MGQSVLVCMTREQDKLEQVAPQESFLGCCTTREKDTLGFYSACTDLDSCAEVLAPHLVQFRDQVDQIGSEADAELTTGEAACDEAGLGPETLSLRGQQPVAECSFSDVPEPDAEESPCMSRPRAVTECSMVLRTKTLDIDVPRVRAESLGPEGKAVKAVSKQLQPQHFNIGEPRRARCREQCRQTVRPNRRKLMVRIADGDTARGRAVDSSKDYCAGTRARTMSDGFQSRRRRKSVHGARTRPRAPTDSVYDMYSADWTNLA